MGPNFDLSGFYIIRKQNEGTKRVMILSHFPPAKPGQNPLTRRFKSLANRMQWGRAFCFSASISFAPTSRSQGEGKIKKIVGEGL